MAPEQGEGQEEDSFLFRLLACSMYIYLFYFFSWMDGWMVAHQNKEKEKKKKKKKNSSSDETILSEAHRIVCGTRGSTVQSSLREHATTPPQKNLT